MAKRDRMSLAQMVPGVAVPAPVTARDVPAEIAAAAREAEAASGETIPPIPGTIHPTGETKSAEGGAPAPEPVLADDDPTLSPATYQKDDRPQIVVCDEDLLLELIL